MEKRKKILAWIFLAMFIVPEILWSPVFNYIYSFFVPTVNGSVQVWRDNFVINSKSGDVALILTVLTVQIIGLIGTLRFIILKKDMNIALKIILVLILAILLVVTGTVAYTVYYMRNGIGF